MLKPIKETGALFEGRLLDLGCGKKPYKNLFPNVSEYIGVDFHNEGHDHSSEDIDVFYDGKTIPFPDDTFDGVLCTEVLEHVEDLEGIMDEIRRVLKPGGKALITVPFVWNEHEMPFDFRRFTLTGITRLFETKGFKIEREHKNGNAIKVLFQLWIMYIYRFIVTKKVIFNILLNIVLIFPFTVIGTFFSFILPRQKDLYFNSIIVLEKE